jgi:hypothetical protein
VTAVVADDAIAADTVVEIRCEAPDASCCSPTAQRARLPGLPHAVWRFAVSLQDTPSCSLGRPVDRLRHPAVEVKGRPTGMSVAQSGDGVDAQCVVDV